jgi:NTE family protein
LALKSIWKARRLCSGIALSLMAMCSAVQSAYADPQTTPRPKVALALGGGGTRGAAHVGVLRVLQKEGIPIDMIAGTSMGAVVGGLYASGLPLDVIEHKFSKPTLMKNFMTVSLPTRMALVPLFAIPHIFLGWKPYDGFYFGNQYRNYLQRSLPENKQLIEELNIPFRAICTNLVTGDLRYLDKGPLARAMQASCAVPVLRRPVPMDDGSLLCDGAMVQNLPCEQARDMGADMVIAVDVDEHLTRVDRDHFRKIGSVGLRVEQIYLARADQAQLDKADVVIHPMVDGIDLLSTKASDAKAAIKAGEEAARMALPYIREKLNAKMKAASSQ